MNSESRAQPGCIARPRSPLLGVVRPRSLLAAYAFVLGVTGCSELLPGALDADSSCSEFLEADREARATVMDELFTAKYGETNSLGATNALLNAEYVCGRNPDGRLGDVSI